jgi:Domain of unknown function (DUF4263)
VSRLDRWTNPQYFEPIIALSGENPDFEALHRAAPHRPETVVSSPAFIGTARELILRVEKGTPTLQIVGFALDNMHLDLVLGPTFALVDPDENTLKRQLAYAAIYEVPVYPDDEEAAEILLRLHTELYTSGFEEEVDGVVQSYRPARGPSVNPRAPDLLATTVDASLTPADVLALRARAKVDEAERDAAERMLFGLRAAIGQLSELLDETSRNENALQQCLTAHPILFGLEYGRIVPKHSLGAEYEMDYALVRHSGLVDLVEIEPSSLRVYTGAHNPTADLVHAEQQVLDWLDWIEQHGPYARTSLPGAVSPRAFVVIGTRRSLTNADQSRLLRRNLTWHGRIEILTYEDLLDRAEGILAVLTRLAAN